MAPRSSSATLRVWFSATVACASALLGGACESPTDVGHDVEVPFGLGRIQAGAWKTCYADISGEIWCWGNAGIPFEPRLETDDGFLAITVGSGVTCGLKDGGVAYCWGQNRYGEVGDGTRRTRDNPTEVSTHVRFSQVSAGIFHVCALNGDGRAYCWGTNIHGALGIGSLGEDEVRTRPVPVATNRRFRALDGSTRRCGLDLSGRAFCWGAVSGSFDDGAFVAPGDCRDTYYQAYEGDQCLKPTPVAGGLTFSSITSGGHTDCGVMETGKAYCWGAGEYGTLGNGTLGSGTHSVEPVAVEGGLSFRSISAGATHVCGLTVDGTAYCWGNNFAGQLGNGSDGQGGGWGIPSSAVPVPVEGGHHFTQVAAGNGHTCALTGSQEVWCWGANSLGELGRDPSLGNSNVPVRVEFPWDGG